MFKSKIFKLKNENLELLRPGDKPIDQDVLDELRGPRNPEEDLQIASLEDLQKTLSKENRELLGERERVSSGVFGPLFKLQFKDKDGGIKYLLERCFVRDQAYEKRVEVEGMFREAPADSQPRFRFFNEDPQRSRFIVDYLYNEAMALQKLQGIEGVPKFYGSVDKDSLYGSTLQEFIDGDDLSELSLTDIENKGFSLDEILERLKRTYRKAAESGFILNNPAEATIMIDQEGRPYITDWYLYSQGNINHEGPMKDLYLKGMADLELMIKNKIV